MLMCLTFVLFFFVLLFVITAAEAKLELFLGLCLEAAVTSS